MTTGGARYYDLAHGNPISDTDTDSDLRGGLEGRSPSISAQPSGQGKGRWAVSPIDPFLAQVLGKVRLRDAELRMCCALAQTTTYIRSSKFQEPRTAQVEGVWGVAPCAAPSANASKKEVPPHDDAQQSRPLGGLRRSPAGHVLSVAKV